MIDTLLLNSKIDVDEPILNADKSAFTIQDSFSCLKLQFLFTFLNVSHIFVYGDNSLKGIISKEDFVRKAMLLE